MKRKISGPRRPARNCPHNPIRAVLIIAALCLPVSLLAQQSFASLEEQMSGEEFEAAGLDKLTPDELAALNNWIRSRSLATLDAPRYGTLPAMSSADGSGESIEDMERETIVSRLNGTFSGWDGQTVFRLENGQLWAQASRKKFYTQEIQNPLVTIEPSMFGGWRLSVQGLDQDVRVRRIQ